MFDMGFIHALRRIVALVPKQRQTELFSATMPAEIASLAKAYLTNPERVEVTPQATAVEIIDQRVIHVDHARKSSLLAHLLGDPGMTRTIVFTRTKHGANRVSERLEKQGVAASAIHGNKSQTAREKALAAFRAGDLRVLVATDLAARGIDVQAISHVVNFDLPNEPESYIHRIGRTARAGATGTAIAFCAPDERSMLKAIERMTRQLIPVTALPTLAPPPAGHYTPAGAREDEAPRHRQSRSQQRPRNGQNQGQRSKTSYASKSAPRHRSPSRPISGGGSGSLAEIGFLRAAPPRGQDR
jgi:ATP-dependent RNA helicase RhlE